MDQCHRKMENLARIIYYYASDGMHMALCSLLDNVSYKKAADDQDLLNRVSAYQLHDNPERLTPLIAATKGGHEKMVNVLIKKYLVKLEAVGVVRIENTMIEGATALWVAAAMGHMNIVKLLIKAGAQVDHGTVSNSTPLRAACYDGRLDIVTFLVKHGADFNKANKYHNTCLMIAAHKGHVNVVQYLLQQGVSPDDKSLCKSTALHLAAEAGWIPVCRELMNHGAAFSENACGMTPLMVAAERAKLNVVEFMLKNKKDTLTIKEKVDALELLGASFANDKENYSPDFAYKYMQQGMALRYADPNRVLRKNRLERIPAYGNRLECDTLEALDAIRTNTTALQMESLIIRERILGTANADVALSIVYRGAVYADHFLFDRCINLWTHALEMVQNSGSSISKDLLRFSQIFSQMIHMKEKLEFVQVERVLRAGVAELKKLKEKLQMADNEEDANYLKEEMETNLLSCLYMVVILARLKKLLHFDSKDDFRCDQLIYQLIRCNVTTPLGQTLLHLCVDEGTPVDNFYTNLVCKFPDSEAAKLLIKCGSDAKALDSMRNTPLHTAVNIDHPPVDEDKQFWKVCEIIKALVEAGAHVDATNYRGLTAYDLALFIAPKSIVKDTLAAFVKPNLKCLAARAIAMNDVPYGEGRIPDFLVKFVDMHMGSFGEYYQRHQPAATLPGAQNPPPPTYGKSKGNSGCGGGCSTRNTMAASRPNAP